MIPFLLAGCGGAAADDDGVTGGGCNGATAGDLGVGGFTADGCWSDDCLREVALAAGSVERLTFIAPSDEQAATDVRSSSGAVLAPALIAVSGRYTTFDLQAVAAGDATVDVRAGDRLIDRLGLAVREVATAQVIDRPRRLVVGGTAVVAVDKRAADGTRLIGRGAIQLAAQPGLVTRPADGDTEPCLFTEPELTITGTAPGVYALPLAGDAIVEVVERAAVVGADVGYAPGELRADLQAGGFRADAYVRGRDAAGEPIDGARCEWTGSRTVTVVRQGCIDVFRSSSGDSLDVTCRFDGRVLVTLTIGAARP